MEILAIHAHSELEEGKTRVSVDVYVSGLGVAAAVAAVLGKIEAIEPYHTLQPDPNVTNVSSASVPAVDTSAQTAASDPVPEQPRRRRRTAAEMEADKAAANPTLSAAVPNVSETTAPPTDASASSEQPRRRRAVAEQPSPDPMPINDAEMSKAASNAAEFYVNLGEDGPATVMLILSEDFGVKSATDIAQDKRQAFIDALQKEMKLAQAEHDAKAAA